MGDYVVVKDGAEIRNYKSLPAAKKLADADGAEVFCDGECVYSGTETVPEVFTPVKYRLKALMNVRRKPSMHAQILSTKAAGTVVRILGIEQDWMHLAEGAYILYESGRWAEKV